MYPPSNVWPYFIHECSYLFVFKAIPGTRHDLTFAFPTSPWSGAVHSHAVGATHLTEPPQPPRRQVRNRPLSLCWLLLFLLSLLALLFYYTFKKIFKIARTAVRSKIFTVPFFFVFLDFFFFRPSRNAALLRSSCDLLHYHDRCFFLWKLIKVVY